MVIDTSILIDCLFEVPEAVQFVTTVIHYSTISAVTATELLAGTRNRVERRRQEMLAFIGAWQPVAMTYTTAILAGELIREHQLSIADAIIAATALEQNATLVTRDRKAYTRIPNLRVLVPY